MSFHVEGSICTLSSGQRLTHALKSGGVFFSLALASIAIPILHFITVPGLLIFSFYWGKKAYAHTMKAHIVGECDSCHRDFSHTYFFTSTKEFRCKKCLAKNNLK